MFVETGQVDVEGVGEVGKVPILHHNHQVHDQNEGTQEGTREFWKEVSS